MTREKAHLALHRGELTSVGCQPSVSAIDLLTSLGTAPRIDAARLLADLDAVVDQDPAPRA